MRALGGLVRRLGYALIHLAHRLDPIKGPFECPRCGGQGNILVRTAAGEMVRQTCAFCRGRGSVMDRRSGVDRRRVNTGSAPAGETAAGPESAAPAAEAPTEPVSSPTTTSKD
jgi:hypothetical protein